MSRPLGPGPGAYMLPPTLGYDRHDQRKMRGPQYSFGLRTGLKDGGVGPGPGAYQIEKMTRYGPALGYYYTMGGKLAMKTKSMGPGPDAYEVHLKPIFKSAWAPAYSMGLRTKSLSKSVGPGPSAYLASVAPVKPGVPAFSIGMRTKLIEPGAKSPGPAAYGETNLGVNKQRAPLYSLGMRTGLKNKGLGPGPNYYDLMYYRPGKTGPSYSFGLRHSQFSPPLIVPCDN